MFEYPPPYETTYEKEYRLRARKRKAIIAVLQKWYVCMRDGTADLYEPDLSNMEVVTFKKPVIEIVARREQEFFNELDRNRRHWEPITEIPHFTRLSGKAKLCFVQDLREALNAISN